MCDGECCGARVVNAGSFGFLVVILMLGNVLMLALGGAALAEAPGPGLRSGRMETTMLSVSTCK